MSKSKGNVVGIDQMVDQYAKAPSRAGTEISHDVGQIIDALLKNGYLGPQHYIANLELGDEVMRGTGTTIVRNYAVKVE